MSSNLSKKIENISSKESRTGYISGFTFENKPVTFSVIDGLAIFEGDIVLGTVEEIVKGPSPEAVATPRERFRWTNRVIPFNIDPNLPNQARVTEAIRHWEDNTPLMFVRRANQPNFVTFRPATRCWSQIGMTGGEQFIDLDDDCGMPTVIHEIGHTVGLWHENSREDRDTFVRIIWDNIQPAAIDNFNQHIADYDDIGPYDYCSIMHYGPFQFCRDPCPGPTIEVLQPTRQCAATIGRATGLSAGDIAAVRQMYPVVEFGRYFAAAPLSDGRLQLWAIERDGHIWSRWKTTTLPTSVWTPWREFNMPSSSGHFAAAPLSDGRLQLWAIDSNGGIWSRWKTTTLPSSVWTNWSGFDLQPPGPTRFIAAAPLSDKRLQLWAVDRSYVIWTCWKKEIDPNSEWVNWRRFDFQLPGVPCYFVAAAPLSDKRLQLWALDTNGAIWTCWKKEIDPNSEWVNWRRFDFQLPDFRRAYFIAAAPLSDKRLEIWVVDTLGVIWSCWKTAIEPHSDWTNWSRFDFHSFSTYIAVAPLSDRRLQLWTIDRDGLIWSCWKTTTSSTSAWTDWSRFE